MSISRSHSNRFVIALAFALLCLGLVSTLGVRSALAADSTEVVNPADLSTTPGATDWHIAFTAGAPTSGIVSGPGTPPLGTGSLQMTTAVVADKRYIMNYDHVNLELSDITHLSYSTYGDSALLAVVLQLQVDPDGAGLGVPKAGGGTTNFTTVSFEPYHANVVTPNVWQNWDVLTGGASVWGSNIEGDIGNANNGTQGNPATWAEFMAIYPNAKITATGGFGVNVGSGWTGAFTGQTDNLKIGYGGNTVTYDFDPAVACTTTCYADAVNGNDLNGGASAGDAKKTIQAAIDAVSANGEVRVLPGIYDETASNRFLFDASGPYQFGLFVEDDAKDGISILGVTAADVVITDPTATEAVITTNATNSFGAAGIFVEADDVTIAGLEIGPNIPGDNKTIEIIGDGFTLKDSFVNVASGGSIYFGDWRYDTGTSTSYIQSYTVDNNVMSDGTSVDISNGAGYSGPVAGRTITDNVFSSAAGQYWPSISFNGDTTTVPWYVYPVRGAIITGNSFTNLDLVEGIHIRTRGVADDSTFDWDSYWNDNTYNKAVVVGVNPPADVRSWSYTTAYTFNDVRMIGAVIQPGVDIAQSGDTVLVKAGIYPESPVVDESVTLLGEDGRDSTFIELQTSTNYTHSLVISGANVTLDGFTIKGIDAACPATLAATNIYLTTAPDNVVIKNNRIQVGLPGGCSTGDDGFGLITTYSGNPDVASLLVHDNIFEPLTAAGGQRAFYINPSVVNFTFRDNSVLGKFVGTALTEAQVNLIEDNTITGDGTSSGIGIWGYLDPGVWGTGTIRGNTISGTVNAISIYDAEDVDVTKNILTGNATGVRVLTAASVPFDQSTIHINRNSISGNTTIGVNNQLDQTDYGDIDATCNWWGAADGPGPVGPGSGDTVSADADFSDWLYTSNLDGLCGVPPVSNVCPVDGMAYLRTDALGIGQGSPSKGIRTRKLVIPNWEDVETIYGQLAAVDVGLMKYVRFLPQGEPKIQVYAPTSPAYQHHAVSWWGATIDEPVKSVKGQFFWGKNGNKAPRAFVLWPTYNTDDPYANVFEYFDDSSTYDVYWDTANGWIPVQTQTLDLPETQGDGATVEVTVALVDVNNDNRSVILTVEVGGLTQQRVITVPNKNLTLNLEEFTFNDVPAGADEVIITLESPDLTGDSAAMIGAAANYECVDLTPDQ